MKPFSRMTMIAVVGLLALALAIPMAFAATDNPAAGTTGVFMMQWHFDSQLTATVTGKANWTMPWPAELTKVKCNARALGGSGTPTYNWVIKKGASSIATCAMATAGTEVEGTVTTSTIADESAMTIDYQGGGTSPTADDVDLILIFKRQ